MVDNIIKLFDVSINILQNIEIYNRLSIASCKATIYECSNDEKLFLGIDEESFLSLNCNNDAGYIDFEFTFNENFKTPYMEFFASCFTFSFIEPFKIIKVNGMHIFQKSWFREKHYTKVNEAEKMCCGIRYYFKNNKDKFLFMNCNDLALEGFVAFGKKTNVYGVAVRLKKDTAGWKVLGANTYKDNSRMSIYNYIH